MIKGSYVAHALLNKLKIDKNEKTIDRMRRFVNRLIQSGYMKGVKEGRNYYISESAIDQIYHKIINGEIELPLSLAFPSNMQKRAGTNQTILNESSISTLETAIKFYRDGYLSIESLSEMVENIIGKHAATVK
jgi:hypothetical protein